jgi:hypothetical protein
MNIAQDFDQHWRTIRVLGDHDAHLVAGWAQWKILGFRTGQFSEGGQSLTVAKHVGVA